MPSPMRSLMLSLAASAMTLTSLPAVAEGDLTTRPERLPDLVLGSEVTDYAMSQARYELETGQAYKLKVVSSGLKEYALQAPGFFESIFLRKVEAGGMEIKAVALTELEFEQAGEAEIYFVPIKPGEFEFYMKGLEHKGMQGLFSVR
ncbi:cupredoxin domain-containing protein [Marinobacterium weihaiense]|uniref:Copper-binding protein n=1 Tax=Marinobacterium weihaiense TaxID=2851016 RepID=A0ABS6M6H4_9GAMM|nr:copper-binding protein [Marinobacterium weihaiense]MBV0931878.1 copper-binding protein [Marinobacterium weihaiense]